MKDLEPLIVEALRKRWLTESNGYFSDEIYADYRDEIDGSTAGEIIDSDDPLQTFYERLEEWYRPTRWDCEDELANWVKQEVGQEIELDDEQEEFIDDYLMEHVSYDYPADHFLDQDIYVNIMVDTGDCNYDFVLNGVYPCWYGEYDEEIHPKAAIVWLAETQGYTKSQLEAALKEGDLADPHGFLQSMRVELANLPSHMSTVTFLVRMTFRDLLALNEAIRWRDRQNGRQYDPAGYPECGEIVLDKETMCGLYDPWSGGGSVLEIELEKDVRLPIRYIWLAIPDESKGHGYQVGDVYGMCGSAWRDTLKEMHLPDMTKEGITC